MNVRQYFLLHVVVTVGNFRSYRSFAVLFVEEIHHVGKKLLFALELFPVVISYYVICSGAIALAVHAFQMEKAFVTFGVHGVFKYRKH